MNNASETMNNIIISKYANPITNSENFYEGSIHNNVSSAEKNVLIRYLIIMYGLRSTLDSFTPNTISILNNHIHQTIQSFIQINISEYSSLFTKKKKVSTNAMKYGLEIISEKVVLLDRMSSVKGSKPQLFECSDNLMPVPKFQIQMIRLILNTILLGRVKQRGLFKEVDLKDEQYTEITTFIHALHEYEAVLGFKRIFFINCLNFRNCY